MARSLQPRAFTLIELMIVMSVIALLSAAAVPALGALTGADARKGAGEIAGAMRWLYDGASVRHATCRLVLSPAKRSYWAECAPGRATISADPEKAAEEERKAEERRQEGADAPDAKEGGVRAPGFARYEDPIARERTLPGEAEFKAIRIDGREALVEGRNAYVHFFPGGRAQAARVTIADGDNVFTIKLEPFTGRARVSAGEPTGRDE
jgi:general secretion pathway protein H